MVLEVKSTMAEPLHEQIDRIVHSEQFHSSEVLRRLLTFLTEKALSGEADNLKEYVIAIDGLGKADSYDPQHNSSVRIQMGRLRQRLAEYYRSEGKNDPIVVDLPKGRFRLTFEQRSIAPTFGELAAVTPPPQAPSIPIPTLVPGKLLKRPSLWLSVVTLFAVLLFCLGYLLGHTITVRQSLAIHGNPALGSLWAPFLDDKFPLIVSIEDPLFAEIRSNPGVYFRDRSMNDWSDVIGSAALNSLTSTFKQSEIRPSRYYTAFGEAEASFLLGGLLKSRERAPSLVRTSQLSWQQLADNNVVFVGVQNLFFNQLRNMPIAPQLVPELNGVRDEHPDRGQPTFYADEYTTAPSEQGTAFALVTHLPGPNGKNDIESFTSNRSAGYVGAVQCFTDPQFARMLESKLKEATGGRIPRYYQVLFRVRYRDSVPTETKFVLGREMH
jgi:Arc/MetJ-type ribon-helix-helix transcriptional regulator